MAGAISLALIVTLVLGVSFAKNANADGKLQTGKWSFAQAGQFNDKEPGNTAYITGVTMADTGENITGWIEGGTSSINQTQSATQDSDGFDLGINGLTWDRNWDTTPLRINPWGIQASVHTTTQAAHVYNVTFKAKANKKKYAYVAFNTEHGVPPYDQAPMREGSDNQIIVIGTTEKTFSYTFDNYVSAVDMTTTLMLGCFGKDDDTGKWYDFAGNEIPSSIISSEEPSNWTGTVSVRDFTVTDLGVNPDVSTDPPAPSTQAPTQAPTVAPQPTQTPTVKPSPAPAKTLAKVTKVKVKSVKKKTIKITWKKVANAKSYQIKVGNKTYKATKNSKKIKNKKFKKGKKVKVKVRAMATGYKTGAWSKTVKKKLTK